MTPTELTLRHMRELGYVVDKTEHWNAFARVRKDLFTFVDVLAVGFGQTVGIQCTSASNVSSRVKKIGDADATPQLRVAGWRLVVHGWKKVKGKWTLREVDCS